MIGIYLCDDEDAVRHQIQTALEWKADRASTFWTWI